MLQIIGSVVVLLCVIGGFLWEGGHLLALWHPSEILIIVGAAFGAFLTSNPPKVVKAAFRGALAEGLRIQIVDAQNRPMFDIGSSRLKDYTIAILRELTPYLNSVPNRISLTGHTDAAPYAGISGMTNWDLSADRANAARRALESGGLATDRVSRVVGPVLVSAVRQGESARGHQSAHQHRGADERRRVRRDQNGSSDARGGHGSGRRGAPGRVIDPIGTPINKPMGAEPAPIPES